MMLILRDDGVIETFDEADSPPSWIEAIDVENNEYRFCDDKGQIYRGEITKKVGMFSAGSFKLIPDGTADIQNALALIRDAQMIADRMGYKDLDSLRKHIESGS